MCRCNRICYPGFLLLARRITIQTMKTSGGEVDVLFSTGNKMATRLAVTVFFFTQGIGFASWASRIPDIKLLLGLNDAQLGTILFALPAGLMTSLPVSGWLVTRFGSRRMVLL